MSERLLRDLIHIPERVQTNDFVLKLSEGVTEEGAAATIRDYVVTDQLRTAFDQALGFIRGAVQGGRSAACYLHGSFGSGKSHFMAVLNLLLAGHPKARGVGELAEVINRHDPWLQGRRFLMVPYHMIGARDVESAVLGGYAEHVRRHHPTAPTPGFYLGESLFRDARELRGTYGDDAFFARLNAGSAAADEGWGEFGAIWDAASFEAAASEPPTGSERQRLVGDLIGTFFKSYSDVAAARGEAFVDFDSGLAIMSAHAKALGYDAVVLFLDELILWLATRAGDVDFVSAEGAKLSKLVEAQNVARPIPIVSFVARQRDLRELIGEHQAGALQVRFLDTLKYWEARFDKVNLEDRNLPVVAERRLLRPVSESAKQEIDAAFETVAGGRAAVVETLLGSEGEREIFRKIYPFSPALVQALIAASSVLQRERTALKLMLTLLVKRRDELRLGTLIPVGDLWDEIATGDQPFSDGMRIQFENAKKLWTQKLLPLLEHENNVSWQDIQDGRADPAAARRLENDARLLKTLLLAALVPEVPALRALTAQRLAALNHGTVKAPVPGGETGIVLQKLRKWATQVGEIRVSEDSVPTVSLQITGVDVTPILANVAHVDNDGTRRTRLRKILFEAAGIQDGPALLASQPFVEHEYVWRGTRRTVDLYFDAVRDIPHDTMRGRGAPVLVLGMPFDPKGRPPATHTAHAQAVPEEGSSGGVVWQPSYLSDRAMRDLGTLVRIDHLLAGAGDRFEEAARHLSASDREQARAILKSQQSALQQRVRGCLETVYGIRPDGDGCVGATVAEGLVSLDRTYQVQMPVGATLADALSNLLDRVFEHTYPGHPLFGQPIQPAALKRVLAMVHRAAQEPDQRIFIEDAGTRKDLSAIAGPLKIGTMAATHFFLEPYWADHFGREQARSGESGPATVGRLREWMDRPKAMGLTPDLQNLVVLAFAAQADRTLVRRGSPVQASLERIEDEVALQEQALPDEETWKAARKRAGALFGLVPPEIRKGATVAALASDLTREATAARPQLEELSRELTARAARFDVPADADRLVTLRAAQMLVSSLLASTQPIDVVTALVRADLRTSEPGVARCIASAGDVARALSVATWSVIEPALGLSDHRRHAAEALGRRIADALAQNEHVVPIGPALQSAQGQASRLLAEVGSPPRQPPPPEPPPEPPPQRPPADDGFDEPHRPVPRFEPISDADEVIDERSAESLDARAAARLLDDLRAVLDQTPGARLTLTWRVTRRGGDEA